MANATFTVEVVLGGFTSHQAVDRFMVTEASALAGDIRRGINASPASWALMGDTPVQVVKGDLEARPALYYLVDFYPESDRKLYGVREVISGEPGDFIYGPVNHDAAATVAKAMNVGLG